MTLAYHCRVAVGHFSRAIAGDAKRPSYAPVVVLQALWFYAPDPYAFEVVVHVTNAELLGLVKSQRALTEALSQLVRVGAINKLHGAYKLNKPAIEELDIVARGQLVVAPTVLGGTESAALARKTPAEREVIALQHKERVQQKAQAEQRRKEALARVDKKLSDVRDVLAATAGVKPNNVRYAGAGSKAVQTAVDWLASTDATWPEFVTLCKFAKTDPTDERPADLLFLFDVKHDDYRTRLAERIAEHRAKRAAAQGGAA